MSTSSSLPKAGLPAAPWGMQRQLQARSQRRPCRAFRSPPSWDSLLLLCEPGTLWGRALGSPLQCRVCPLSEQGSAAALTQAAWGRVSRGQLCSLLHDPQNNPFQPNFSFLWDMDRKATGGCMPQLHQLHR